MNSVLRATGPAIMEKLSPMGNLVVWTIDLNHVFRVFCHAQLGEIAIEAAAVEGVVKVTGTHAGGWTA